MRLDSILLFALFVTLDKTAKLGQTLLQESPQKAPLTLAVLRTSGQTKTLLILRNFHTTQFHNMP